MDKGQIQRTVTLAVCMQMAARGEYYVPAAASARHVHLSKSDVATLFGEGYELKPMKPLTQPGQFAAEEKVDLTGPRGSIKGVRVLGPSRKDTQIEISLTDSFKLGIKPIVRMSGDIAFSSGAKLTGPKGSIDLPQGVIIAARHMHISKEEAAAYGLKDGQIVSVKKNGPRETTFGNVVVRSGDGHSLEVHLDTDEANAAMLTNGDLLEIIR
jgi:putative phosphotransacetylase